MTNQDETLPKREDDIIQSKAWLKIIGIGENGVEGLSEAACLIISNAEHVFGGMRHLALLDKIIHGTAHIWPQPFLNAIEELKLLRGQDVVVLTTGDPMHYGAGATICRHFDLSELSIISHPSSFSLAAARLGWALQDVDCLSIHGRAVDSFVRSITNKRKMLILANDGASASFVGKELCARGYDQSQIFVLEHLEGRLEAVHFFLAKDFEGQHFAKLNIIGVNCLIDPAKQQLPSFSTLPDDAFIHDGQISKRDIRAITMAHLAPTSHELLWDIGAGSGSISIEWLRLGYDCRAIAIEKNVQRAQNIRQNADNLGVSSHLTLVEASAVDVLKHLEEPDAIFIGGGLSNNGLFDQCWQKLKLGGRLVVNAVTLESEALVLEISRKYGGHLHKIVLSSADELGNFHVWRQALPITMLILRKNTTRM
ncbi:precorrin-6y C5,15-methyltransferase (decarboxylating) subunit CbiE [Bartonella sp. HY329]|uniref:precorrin-6y C5,15-methyltransferase (decarboxylating) subunit CbiE n=1 Tax=unclassified Bartonella TaxID=2645622 RepID=UPI0021C83D68|nr:MULTISPECIES: precorrin-6y C5,15-methyltransferase (decarboxylating) subunit CbiE [unclassified Bartonella]UXM96216.1 precorrin-6y C5,15-methyltransferase (decarboxylating) subunit CbiE [Bartonella sp. HY329]UXN10540.1 precorrin-6y C5,15-methyltransferase (decarboxylating) subunit CbiE [Bartonella sp. HY328]